MVRWYELNSFDYDNQTLIDFDFYFLGFAQPLQLEDGDVVAFIGGTDLVRIQKGRRIRSSNHTPFQGFKY